MKHSSTSEMATIRMSYFYLPRSTRRSYRRISADRHGLGGADRKIKHHARGMVELEDSGRDWESGPEGISYACKDVPIPIRTDRISHSGGVFELLYVRMASMAAGGHARPNRNQGAHPVASIRPRVAEARSSDPELRAARPADESTRTTWRTRRGGLPEDRARMDSANGARGLDGRGVMTRWARSAHSSDDGGFATV
jgi:hypothetical protein